MNDRDVVCRCNTVTVRDVKMYMHAMPDMPKDQLKAALKIGSRCGGCQMQDCPTIDIKFEHAFEQITNYNDQHALRL